jgi:hypothetical protein
MRHLEKKTHLLTFRHFLLCPDSTNKELLSLYFFFISVLPKYFGGVTLRELVVHMEYSLSAIDSHSDDVLDLVTFLMDEGFLVDAVNCRRCQGNMELEYFNRNEDGVVWRCRRQDCRRYLSVREGSFFAHSHLSISIQIRLVILFASEATVLSSAKLLGVSRRSVTDYFIECRRMYSAELVTNPITFAHGGEYEVDECLIQRIKIAQAAFVPVWVQSILERRTRRVFLHRIPSRSRPSMVPPVQLRVPANSIVYSDEHKSYGNLRHLGYYHATVNHSRGEYQRWGVVGGAMRNIHINGCEGINSMIRRRLSYKSRRTIEYLDLVLSEIMYRKSGRSLFAPFK